MLEITRRHGYLGFCFAILGVFAVGCADDGSTDAPTRENRPAASGTPGGGNASSGAPGGSSNGQPPATTPPQSGPMPVTPTPTTPPSPTTPPGPTTPPVTTEPLPVPAGGTLLYFSDCQEGAAPSCVPGNDANPGTEAAPKRDWRQVNYNAMPAGSQFRFARGGSWTVPLTRLDNNNVTPTAPLVFDAYGTGPAPLFRGTRAAVLIEFGPLNNQNNDGGYTFRNLKLDGLGITDWGFWLRDNLRNVTIDSVELTGFAIAIHSQQSAPHYITQFALRNSTIIRNRSMGILGGFTASLIEGNRFEANNFSGSGFEHAIYLSGGRDIVIRNNSFIRNSVVNGRCTGGNVTFHGQQERVTIEGNLILQDAGDGGCYGFSVTPGYTTGEWFRNFVLRANTVINTGYCSYCIGAAPGVRVENNLAIKTEDMYHAAVNIPSNVDNSGPAPGDDADANAIVTGNTLCQPQPHAQSTAARVTGPGSQVSNNVLRTGADATTGPCAR